VEGKWFSYWIWVPHIWFSFPTGTDVHQKDNSLRGLLLAPNLFFYPTSLLWMGQCLIHILLSNNAWSSHSSLV
jgi:hypothetical protein